MARYTGPSWKISRRLGYSILENGKELQKRPYAPGQHGQARRILILYLSAYIKGSFLSGYNA